ncbi:MAG: PDZ domain-containing protein, partial [Chloroflexota bacterium]
GSGDLWSPVIEEMERGWKNALENLASVCETGEDIRFVSRPMLGIVTYAFNEEIAKKLGVPETRGILISDTVEGMGAEAAGLTSDDVLISMDGIPTIDSASLNSALNVNKAGDTVEVVYYRGAEKQSVMMTLSGRPLPEIPPTAQELADAVGRIYKQFESQLDDFLVGVSEDEASFNPSNSAWSIKRNLAHFVQGERSYQQYLGELIGGYERYADDWGGNINELLDATISVFPTVPELVAEYKRHMVETLYVLANLPDEFVDRKGIYWGLAYNKLQESFHFDGHLEMMQAALDEARQK